jgi:hypothetical protein
MLLTRIRFNDHLKVIIEEEGHILQHGEKIGALPVIGALGQNTSWGTEIESRNVLFLPR